MEITNIDDVCKDFPLDSLESYGDDDVKVVVRLKPSINPQDESLSPVTAIDNNTVEVPKIEGNINMVSGVVGDAKRNFNFDYVFGTNSTQTEVYNFVAEEMLDLFFTGYNSTILAYGQTGSGKSYTMFGSSENQGLIPRICHQIFDRIRQRNDADSEYVVSVSFLEIYLEKVYDLLGISINKRGSPRKGTDKRESLTIHESTAFGVYVEGATAVSVGDGDELLQCIHLGETQRYKGMTDMNLESSRSHAIVKISLVKRDNVESNIQNSDLFLVDLAGSEKVSKTNAIGTTLEEAKKINLSLSSLGKVINALTQKDKKRTHIPYRDSQLTRLLRDSLGGNSKTTLILNCSTDKYNESETVTTLRFGSRAKRIKNKAIVNKSDLFLKKKLEDTITRAELKEVHFKLKIKQLEQEIESLKCARIIENEVSQLELASKNKKLIAQLESLKTLFNVSDDPQVNNRQLSVDDLLKSLMEKCELLVDLQAKFDERTDQELSLKREIDDLKEVEKRLTKHNETLTEQFSMSQLQNLNLTNENMTLSKDIATIHRISKTRAERIQVLESTVRELSDIRLDNDLNLSSSFEAIKEVHKSSSAISPTSLGWWGVFGPSRKSSTSSVNSGGLAKIPNNDTKRARKTGFNLHVVKAPIFPELDPID